MIDFPYFLHSPFRESRALRPGEGNAFGDPNTAPPGRYRVRPPRREGKFQSWIFGKRESEVGFCATSKLGIPKWLDFIPTPI